MDMVKARKKMNRLSNRNKTKGQEKKTTKRE